MFLKRKINEVISRFKQSPKLDQNFIYPYSNDKEQKRKEIWSNLQKGILFEDTLTFINWETPFNQLNKFKEQRRDSGDRTVWYFGKRKIIDGYESHIESMMWMYLPWTNPFREITERIGHDYEGEKRFHELINYFTDLLGEPTSIEIEKWGKIDLGEVTWVNGRVRINIIGFEMHNVRYHLNIGLIEDKNEEYFDEIIEELKASGLTEEELGK